MKGSSSFVIKLVKINWSKPVKILNVMLKCGKLIQIISNFSLDNMRSIAESIGYVV